MPAAEKRGSGPSAAIIEAGRQHLAAQSEAIPTDPSRLDVVYKAAVMATLDGSHLVSAKLALRLGGLMLQILHGNHEPERHKAGFLDDLTVVLPKEVATTRGIEEALFAEHARATALELSVSELKAEYLRACFRGDWWGCLWFDVWDDLRRTSRRILCISPDEIGVADVQTRAKVTAWPMRRVQRWAAPKGAVTIDFLPGEDPGAQNEVASFQTDAAASISEALAGLLQIGRQAKQAGGAPTSPKKKTRWASAATGADAPAAKPPTRRPSAKKSKAGASAKEGGAVPEGLAELAAAITKARAAVTVAETTLSQPPSAGGSDAAAGAAGSTVLSSSTRESSVAECDRQAGGLAAAAARMIVVAGATQLDRGQLVGVVRAVAGCVQGLPEGPRRIAALADTPAMTQNTVAATRAVCAAVRSLLTALDDLSARKGASDPLLAAGTDLGTAIAALLRYTHTADGVQGKTLGVPQSQQDAIKAACQGVRAAGKGVLQSAKDIAGICVNPDPQAKAIAGAKRLAETLAQLTSCVGVTAATVDHPLCLEHLREAIKLTQASVASLATVAAAASADKTYTAHLKGEAKLTAAALGKLDALLVTNAAAATAADPKGKAAGRKVDKFAQACRGLTAAADGLYRALGEPVAMVKEAAQIAKGASTVVALLQDKAKAAEKDNKGKAGGEASKRSAGELRRLADVITETSRKLVKAAKSLATAPADSDRQEELLQIGNALGGLGLRSREYV